MRGEDVMCKIEGVKERSVRLAGSGARSTRDHRREIEVDTKRRRLGHDVSDLALDAGKESCAFGEDVVLIWLR